MYWTKCETCIHQLNCKQREKYKNFCKKVYELRKETKRMPKDHLNVDIIVRCSNHEMLASKMEEEEIDT